MTLWLEVKLPAAGLAVGAAMTVPSTGQFTPVHNEPVTSEAKAGAMYKDRKPITHISNVFEFTILFIFN